MARNKQEDWFWQVTNEFDRFTEEMLKGAMRPAMPTRRFWEPRVDVFENEHSLMIKAELAGVEMSALHVVLGSDQRTLIIKGSRQEIETEPEPRTGCYHLEIYYGDFERRILLPEKPLDKDNIKAAYKNGFLLVTIPKLSEEQRQPLSRTIPVTE